MHGPNALVARLLYGADLHLSEALRVRVKDLDFEGGRSMGVLWTTSNWTLADLESLRTMPISNPSMEGCSGECLNQHWFTSLPGDAKQIIDRWRQAYNRSRPHNSLEYLSPAEYLSIHAPTETSEELEFQAHRVVQKRGACQQVNFAVMLDPLFRHNGRSYLRQASAMQHPTATC